MHNFVEQVRRQIENSCGDEAYLASFSFLHLNEILEYENSSWQLASTDDFDLVNKKIDSTLSGNLNWQVNRELYAWAAAVLRDLAHGLLASWYNRLQDDLLKPLDLGSQSKDAPVMILEASCDLINRDPNYAYFKLFEIVKIAENIGASCHSIIKQTAAWRKLQDNTTETKADGQFTKHWLKNEKANLILLKHRDSLLLVGDLLKEFSELKDFEYQAFWQEAYLEFKAFIKAFDAIINKDMIFVDKYDFLGWLGWLFPAKVAQRPNLLLKKDWYHKIIIKLKQATYCLHEYLSQGESPFVVRDKIINAHIKQCANNLAKSELSNRQQAKLISLDV